MQLLGAGEFDTGDNQQAGGQCSGSLLHGLDIAGGIVVADGDDIQPGQRRKPCHGGRGHVVFPTGGKAGMDVQVVVKGGEFRGGHLLILIMGAGQGTRRSRAGRRPAARGGGRSINERKVMMKKVILLLAFAAMTASTGAQKVAVKNNVVYDVLATPNLGVELGLGRATTLDISGNYNPFEKDDGKMFKHWLVQPEFRYWLCERFNGHFFGVHLLGGEYNISKVKLPFGLARDGKEHRYDGWYVGGGFSYGYQWMLARKWSIEATVGVGYVRFDYDKYGCRDCSPRLESGTKNYFGPTKLGVNLIFIIN